MKLTKRLIALLTVVALCLCIGPVLAWAAAGNPSDVEDEDISLPLDGGITVVASGSCGEQLTWKLDSTGLLTVSGIGAMDNYSAPWKNYKSAIKKVVIASGVTSVGSYAFEDCTALTNVVISDSCLSVGNSAFYGCTSLVDVDLGKGVQTIGDSAFNGCTKLKNLTLPESVADIQGFAFAGSGLTKTTLPASVTEIAYGTFAYCEGLSQIGLPGTLTTISSRAFDGATALETVNFDGSEQEWSEVEIGSNNAPLLNANIVFSVVSDVVPGDFTGDGFVTNEDVVYLLWNTLFGDEYPIHSDADFVKDGNVNNEDVVYLLWNTLFPEEYPL